jgi:hypothetical protein
MAAYDALPADLRRWLAAARLPWSAQSALRLWNKARISGVDAYELLDRAERATLARERPL